MPMISPQDQQTLQDLFAELDGEVTITTFTPGTSGGLTLSQACDYCQETRALLEEVTAFSDKLHLETRGFAPEPPEGERLGVTHFPALVLRGRAKGTVRYFGIPAGYEFTTLVEDLLDLSKGETQLGEQTRLALEKIDQDLHVQVFVTPSCPYCPRAARLAHQLAMENAHITADVIEISEFPDLAQRYQVQGVPKTVINDRIEVVGAVPESRLLQHLLRALEPAQEA